MNIPMRTNSKVRARTRRTNARGHVSVTREHKEGGQIVDEHHHEHEIEDILNCANPAYVGVNQGMTRNLGDYNSVKIGVSVSLPCLPEDGDIRRAKERASQLVDEFMDEEYEAAVEE